MNLRVKTLGILAVLLLLALVRPLPAQDDERPQPVCPLSEDQTQKSIQAFAALAPIFREPRCINCHGAVDPFSENGGHVGGKRELLKDADGNPLLASFNDCQNCHSLLPGWRVPDPDMFFTGKDTVGLSKLMRYHFPNAQASGNSFLEHMTHDNNGNIHFIDAAFKGLRADPDLTAQPPAGWNHPLLIQRSKAWVDAMGGRFHGDYDCGCSPQHYDLELDYEVIRDLSGLPGMAGQYDTKTQGQNLSALEIPLRATAPGKFQGQAVMTLEGSGQIFTPDGGCIGQSQQSFLVHATAQLDEGDEESQGSQNKLHVKLTCDRVQEEASGACPNGAGSQNGFSPCTANVDVDFPKANVGSANTQTFPVPFPNFKATMTATITKD